MLTKTTVLLDPHEHTPRGLEFMGTPDPNISDAHPKLLHDTEAEVRRAARRTQKLCDNGILL